MIIKLKLSVIQKLLSHENDGVIYYKLLENFSDEKRFIQMFKSSGATKEIESALDDYQFL